MAADGDARPRRIGVRALAERFAAALARELRAVGITLDYAPVLDIHTNPKNPVIGDRALAETAEEVARLGRVIIRTLQGAGVAACGKHFPGHGDTSTDSHHELPLVEHPPDRLRAVEFEPFRAAIAERVAFIMTAHVLVPSLDEDRPATLSPKVVQALLREELGYEGVILSDDLEMKAVSAQVRRARRRGRRRSAPAATACSSAAATSTCRRRTLEALVQGGGERRDPGARAWTMRSAAAAGQGAVPRSARPHGCRRAVRELRGLLGREEHQVVAAEMAAFL